MFHSPNSCRIEVIKSVLLYIRMTLFHIYKNNNFRKKHDDLNILQVANIMQEVSVPFNSA